jgi:endonuclease YncB( thermonuclease family)
VRLLPEPVTDRVDQYGRLLRYVVRVRDGVNVNIRLVTVGAAAPYFYGRRRGRYADLLEARARRARRRNSASGVPALARPTTPTRGSQRGGKSTGGVVKVVQGLDFREKKLLAQTLYR